MSNRPTPTRRTTAKKAAATKATAKAGADRTIQEIAAGRCDDRLLDIATAIALRIRETGTTFAWRFSLDGVEVGEYDVTADEWEDIEALTGVPWGKTNPDPASGGSIRHTKAVASVLLLSRSDAAEDAVIARVGGLTLAELEQLFTSEQRSAPLSSPT
jgi:hypothetical protein